MLTLSEIHTYYDESHILQGVTLEVPRGSITTLLGRNGMGKTTTIHSIIGFNQPTQGKIFFKGVDITNLPAFQIAQMGIALVPQGRRIFRSLTVKENLIIGWRKGNNSDLNNELEQIYNLFPVLKARINHLGQHLSGGEQQMLAIGRALLTNPELILMDEPFEGLAPSIIKNISGKIIELKNSGFSILLVEQNIYSALRLADYVYLMNKGKITYKGDPSQLQDKEDLKKYFSTKRGTLHAVDGVSFDIYEGETLGLVGESGCGKSTLGRVMIRLLEATGGRMCFEGENIFKYSPSKMKRLREKVQIVFQDPYSSLDPRLSVSKLIAEPLIVNRYYKTSSEMNARVLELMDTVGLARRLFDSYPHELDGGRRQRIGIARALALYPKFIVLDEPVSALDVCIQAQILNLLANLKKEKGLTYIFIAQIHHGNTVGNVFNHAQIVGNKDVS